MRCLGRRAVGLAAALILAATVAEAQGFRVPDSDFDAELLRIDEEEYLGVKVDSDLAMVDHTGREFTMAEMGGEPLILVLSYYTCDGFCPAFNVELKNVLEKVEALERVKIGRDFRVLTLSFDKNDNEVSSESFWRSLRLPSGFEKDWKVATFKKKEDIKAFTSSLGYRYFWSPADRMFFHPNAYFFISPDGRVVRILHNSLSDAKDMELAIIDTKFDRLRPSEVINLVVGLCYSYNFKEGKYGLNYPLFIAVGSLFTGISAFFFAAFVQRRKTNA